MSATWTDDRVETLARLWKDGLSASQIARNLGGVTRNAVIGKVHRLGLPGRAAPHRPGAGRPAPRRERRGRIPPTRARRKPYCPPPLALALPETGLATVLTLRAGQCRWPIGDPQDDSFCLCGRPRERGAYCAAHGAVAYRATARDHLVKLAGWAAMT
jgi:GcrA cell cycle regulator